MGSISSKYADLLDRVEYTKQHQQKVAHSPNSNQQPSSSPPPPVHPEVSEASPETPKAPADPKKLKACCACPETKKLRDECIVENGEEQCGPQIEAHKKCMREAGFEI